MFKKIVPVLFAVVMLAGGAWLIMTGQLVDTNSVFEASPKLNRDQARSLYRNALQALKAKHYVTAAQGFKQLEGVYPALRSVINLHQAEAFQAIPNELEAQKALKRAIDLDGGEHNPLYPQLLYELACSDFRSKEYKQAKERFQALQKKAAQKEWAKASDYFLGLMGMQKAEGLTPKEGLVYLSRYLTHSPEGRYAAFAANALQKQLVRPSDEQKRLIGIGLANNPDYAAEAISLLAPLPRQKTWQALAKAQIAAQQPMQGVKTLMDGFAFAASPEEARTALASIVAHGGNSKPLLQSMTKQKTRHGDLVLWELTDGGASNNLDLYRNIVARYPKGDYAPESSWHLVWAKRADSQAFLEACVAHEQLFRQSRSYPRVVFWHAKMLEQQNRKPEAVRLYHQLSKAFPHHYYGYRALARLNMLTKGTRDAGWQLTPVHYPAHSMDVPEPEILSQLPDYVKGSLQELMSIGASEDADLLADRWLSQEAKRFVMPWVHWHSGERTTALKLLRNRVEENQVKGEPIGSELLRQAYPIRYADLIIQFSRLANVDPYLVTALMREESSFNPRAASPSAAYGLMQLLLPTANEQLDPKDRPCTVDMLYDPKYNILAGTRYVNWLMNYTPLRKDARLVVASYNAGPGQVGNWLTLPTKDPDVWVESLPAYETREYVKKVFTSYWTYQQLYSDS